MKRLLNFSDAQDLRQTFNRMCMELSTNTEFYSSVSKERKEDIMFIWAFFEQLADPNTQPLE
ncbi:hypothetical protein MYP_672 [Sporocytophaga myxococcoides]|uniref:Uncharacterized protein n=1 Tax=Sporocytophaga myxococcoides TaxID=153721 RepID=A0A098L984_9BACT|nr:hypothetical protein MYP_672 [Sporocytophaga myxococcoides]